MEKDSTLINPNDWWWHFPCMFYHGDRLFFGSVIQQYGDRVTILDEDGSEWEGIPLTNVVKSHQCLET